MNIKKKIILFIIRTKATFEQWKVRNTEISFEVGKRTINNLQLLELRTCLPNINMH
jgi:hypothetical protein